LSKPKLTTPRSGWGGRGYRIPGRKEVYPGVTTVLKVIAKPGVDQWIADQTAAKAVVSIPYLMSVAEEVAWGSLRFFWSKTAELVGSEVRRYWEGVRDDAAELGTNIHEWVEADLDGITPYPEPSSIEADEMIEAWQGWFAEHEVVSHRQEFTCVNDEIGFAGTADADWDITCLHDPDEHGKFCLGETRGPFRTLVDLKSSRHTWDEHGYQLAALASCKVIMREVVEGHEGAQRAEKTENGKKVRSWWVEDARPEWMRYALLHIRPDDLDTEGRHIPRFAKIVDRTEDMDIAIDGFVGAFMIARTQKAQKARDKARGIITEETEI
jgi:hypothetical protein